MPVCHPSRRLRKPQPKDDAHSKSVVVFAANSSEPDTERWPIVERSMYTTYIELVVDSEIIDLNRINLSTVVVDKRFKEQK